MNVIPLSRQALLTAALALVVGGTLMSDVPSADSQERGRRGRAAAAAASDPAVAADPAVAGEPGADDAKLAQITLGSGCFWCIEAVFEQLQGVHSAVSGYANGHMPNPDYKSVCTGNTGHAEVVQVTYDPEVITFAEILEVFWKTHDPTTLNQQGPDFGTQYRSGVFYHTQEQRKEAEYYLRKLDDAQVFGAPIVTEITALDKFYPAEDYHQEYFARNPYQGYCRAVIQPKLKKFRHIFADKIKPEYQ